ncbi:hypothetical protein HPP92_025916 [Vanilla planifolia]|uniref:Uncharacterized protein n=1 Tax=Vanilla planifolia TaxID=51239 RepID=A0A835PN92_VANPL|nr:hypothetical protein HPP92_025916 [Vanilla planifolia]
MLHPEQWPIAPPEGFRLSRSGPSSPQKHVPLPKSDPFHVAHKIPVGDTPYVKAKKVQLVDKDPERAIALFWAAINAGDRVDSALKDMATVMKQQNRTEEAIEAIKSLRTLCSNQSQESLDNILLDLYKRCGRLDEQIALLRHKLLLIQHGLAFNGKRTKTARSQGKKFQVSIEQEATRLLGNLGWALMQKENYEEAEQAYRKALVISADNNKMCNLGICLMKQGRLGEAKETLKKVTPAVASDGLRGGDSHLKAFERAKGMLHDLESKAHRPGLFGSSKIWQPHPCAECIPQHERFGDENGNRPDGLRNSLNVDAKPFYSMKHRVGDALGKMKRSREGSLMEKEKAEKKVETEVGDKWPELPEDEEFQEAIVAAVLAPVVEDGGCGSPAMTEEKMGKRLRIFRDITRNLNTAATA